LVIVPVPYETLKFAGYKVTLPGGTKEGLKMRTAKILVQEYNFSPGGATYQREEWTVPASWTVNSAGC
jgi:hypothetical protein